MNITTLQRVLPVLNECRLTSWLWGYHGKGKSQTVESYYKGNGWLCFNFRLNTQADVGDFLGLQDFITDPVTGEKVATKFCMPEWLKQAMDFVKNNPGKRACIFIDEINRAARFDLLGPVFQMSLDRKLHTYDFSALDIDIVCAANPDNGNYSVLSLDDKALLSRFVHIYFNPTAEEFHDYAVKKKFEIDILDFLGENPDALEERDLGKFTIDDYARPDRRKWESIDRLLKAKLSKEDEFEVLQGMLGLTVGTSFFKFRQRDDKGLTLEDIMDKYQGKIQKRVKGYVENNRTDILHNAVTKVHDFFKTSEQLNDKKGENVIRFMNDLPLGIMFDLAHKLYKDRRFYDFTERNPEIKAEFIAKLEQARGKSAEIKTS